MLDNKDDWFILVDLVAGGFIAINLIVSENWYEKFNKFLNPYVGSLVRSIVPTWLAEYFIRWKVVESADENESDQDPLKIIWIPLGFLNVVLLLAPSAIFLWLNWSNGSIVGWQIGLYVLGGILFAFAIILALVITVVGTKMVENEVNALRMIMGFGALLGVVAFSAQYFLVIDGFWGPIILGFAMLSAGIVGVFAVVLLAVVLTLLLALFTSGNKFIARLGLLLFVIGKATQLAL